MKIEASITRQLPGMKIEAAIIPSPRGGPSAIEYYVTVWATSGGFSTPIPGGEGLLPPEYVNSIKLELWEKIRP